MTNHDRPTENETFDERIRRLRLKIDSLPARPRLHLFELAEVIEAQHRRMHERGGHPNDARN